MKVCELCGRKATETTVNLWAWEGSDNWIEYAVYATSYRCEIHKNTRVIHTDDPDVKRSLETLKDRVTLIRRE